MKMSSESEILNMKNINNARDEVEAEDRYLAKNIEGTVKWFSRRKLYGFIKRSDCDEDVFVHLNALKRRRVFPFRRIFIKKDDRVRFNIVKTEKGCEARYVRLLRNSNQESDNKNEVFTGKKLRRNGDSHIKNDESIMGFMKNLVRKVDENENSEYSIREYDLKKDHKNYGAIVEILENMDLHDDVRIVGFIVKRDSEKGNARNVKVSSKAIRRKKHIKNRDTNLLASKENPILNAANHGAGDIKSKN